MSCLAAVLLLSVMAALGRASSVVVIVVVVDVLVEGQSDVLRGRGI